MDGRARHAKANGVDVVGGMSAVTPKADVRRARLKSPLSAKSRRPTKEGDAT